MECSVCYEKKPSMNFDCKHPLCYTCFVKSGSFKCPMCRGNLDKGISDETKELVQYIGQQNNKIKSLEDEIFALKKQLQEYDNADNFFNPVQPPNFEVLLNEIFRFNRMN